MTNKTPLKLNSHIHARKKKYKKANKKPLEVQVLGKDLKQLQVQLTSSVREAPIRKKHQRQELRLF